jgi:hypothetical protein
MFIRKITISERFTDCHRVYNYDNNIHLHCSLKGEGLKTSHDRTDKKKEMGQEYTQWEKKPERPKRLNEDRGEGFR